MPYTLQAYNKGRSKTQFTTFFYSVETSSE